MSDYSIGVNKKEDLNIADKIGISDIIEVYTEYYPLLRLKKFFYYDKYQKISNDNIILNTVSGFDFLDESYLVSYLNYPINDYDVYCRFSSSDDRYYDTVTFVAVSGDFGVSSITAYDTAQELSIGERTRLKISDRHGITINLPAIQYSGDMDYNLSVSGDAVTQFYPNFTDDYYINESLCNGEIVLKPSSTTSIRSYNFFSDNYPYNITDTYYINNQDLVSGEETEIIIDDFENSVPIYFSGFDNLNYEIPFYIGDNDKYFKIYKQDDITDRTSRVLLVEETNYKIDYDNGKIKLYGTIDWDPDTELWIENYVYDKIYYKYLSSTRFEIGDTDNSNYQFSHTQLRKIFHKALQKILFWIPLSYSSDDGYIVPRLDARMIDFVAELAKLIAMQNMVSNKLSNGIMVADGDTKLDLNSGSPSAIKLHEINIKEAEKKIRVAIEDYCLEMGYMNGRVETTQYTTGSLF